MTHFVGYITRKLQSKLHARRCRKTQAVTAQENNSFLSTRKFGDRSLCITTHFSGYIAKKTAWQRSQLRLIQYTKLLGKVMMKCHLVEMPSHDLNELKTVIQCLRIKPKAINICLLYQGHWSQWHIKLHQDGYDRQKVNNNYSNFDFPSCKDHGIKDR